MKGARKATKEGPLQLEYKTVLQELQSVRELARSHMAPSGSDALQTLYRQLAKLRTLPAGGKPKVWGTRSHTRITTKPSKGGYQPGSRGKLTVYGAVEFTWEIENVEQAKKKKGEPYRFFHLAGLASTRVYIYTGDDKLIARWNLDVGDRSSPGCHFHIQIPEQKNEILIEEQTAGLYSKIDVPRWPSLFFMPTDALDFVLGELFQDDWRKRADAYVHNHPAWRKCQQTRLQLLLEWMTKTVATADGAAWLAVKRAKPHADLLQPANRS